MENNSEGSKSRLEEDMKEYLLEQGLDGRYSILDFQSREAAEVFRRDGTMYSAKGLDHTQLGTAMADLYRELCLPDRSVHHRPAGIRYLRRESETDPVLEALIQFSEGVNTLYQSWQKPQSSPPMDVLWTPPAGLKGPRHA